MSALERQSLDNLENDEVKQLSIDDISKLEENTMHGVLQEMWLNNKVTHVQLETLVKPSSHPEKCDHPILPFTYI